MTGYDPTRPELFGVQWHKTAAHLVQAHHVDPSLIVADPPGLNALFALHSKSHQAIASSPELTAEVTHQHEHLPSGAYDPPGWKPFPSVLTREPEHQAATGPDQPSTPEPEAGT